MVKCIKVMCGRSPITIEHMVKSYEEIWEISHVSNSPVQNVNSLYTIDDDEVIWVWSEVNSFVILELFAKVIYKAQMEQAGEEESWDKRKYTKRKEG